MQQAVHPRVDPISAVSAALAALLAEIKADRESRQLESTRSEERFDRLEDWVRKKDGGSSRDGGPPVVQTEQRW